MPRVTAAESLERAERHAWSLSARYFGCPVYLVGSALHDPDPRDIDMVVCVPDPLFEAMYQPGDPWVGTQPPEWWSLWSRDCAKESRWMTERCMRTVDFTVQSATMFEAYKTQEKRLLACVSR